MTLLSVRDLRVSFGAVQAVRGVSFDLAEESTLALVGESGSGKSVTALSILSLLPPNARVGGEILFQGKRTDRKLRGAAVSMIFQEPMSSLNPVFSVGFQVGEALRQHLGLSRTEARERALRLFEEVLDRDGTAVIWPAGSTSLAIVTGTYTAGVRPGIRPSNSGGTTPSTL